MKVYSSRLNGRPLPLAYYVDPNVDAQKPNLAEGEAPPAIDIDNIKIGPLSFFDAAEKDFPTLMSFLASGVDPNTRESGKNGATAMHYAARGGEAILIRTLYDNGGDVNVRAADGQTPLMWAVAKGHVDTTAMLLTLGADPALADDEGHTVAFYGAMSPLALHTIVLRANYDISKLTDKLQQTPLHHVAEKPNARLPVLYLVEQGGVDVNAVDNRGRTALHYAAMVGDVDTVKALLLKGASWTTADASGFTPISQPQCNGKVRDIINKFSNEKNNTARDRLCAVDASNWSQLDFAQLKHFSVAFLVPNLLIVLGALYMPTIVALVMTGAAGGGFAMVASFGMKQKRRSLATAGWFAGALTFGSIILSHFVIPTYEAAHDETRVPMIWMAATTVMFVCYLRAVMADPGAVQSTTENRATIYENVARVGESEIQRMGYDTTTMVVKPLRSKHCTHSHLTVYRFDHYCVWTGNAIGGGNHRLFVWYAMFQVVAQICVMRMTYMFMWHDGPAAKGVTYSFKSFFQASDWFFSAENTIVTVFLLFYNTFVIIFVGMVVLTQIWYATRNVTSNEVWFVDRYKWMFKLGSRAYSLYDLGMLKNVIGFFWSDNLCAELHTVPAMNDHLVKVCRKYTNKMKSQQASMEKKLGGGGCCNDKSCSSNNNANPSSPRDGEIGSQPIVNPHNASSSPTGPSQSFDVAAAVAEAPQEKIDEMQVVQSLLQQLIKGEEPTTPTSIEAERRERMLQKAKTMHEHFKRATQMQQMMQQQQQQAFAQQQQQQPAQSPLTQQQPGGVIDASVTDQVPRGKAD